MADHAIAGWSWLGECYMILDQKDKAMEAFESVLVKNPSHFEALKHLGLSFFKLFIIETGNALSAKERANYSIF